MLQRVVLLLFVLIPFALIGQDTSGNLPTNSSNHAPLSGPKLFQAYCAVCHGGDGKGNGPMATALKTWPTDLTSIAKRNGGTFPALHVMEAINGEHVIPAHGSRDMPVWGPVFRSMAHGHADNAQLRTSNVTSYIESIQEK